MGSGGSDGQDAAEKNGWFSVNTLKEPYRVEGKKTMGYEIAEQLEWSLPDVIVYPTGGGTGLVGMWKAFDEMEALGWVGSKRPRMVSVQARGCAPVVRAFENGDEFADPWENASTLADGLRSYSERGQAYVDTLKGIITTNQLDRADTAVFRDEDLRFLVTTDGEEKAAELRKEIEALRQSGELAEIIARMRLD